MNTRENDFETRKYLKADGHFRIITLSRRDWGYLDYLLDEYPGYPYWDMIDDIEESAPAYMFNIGFGNLVRFSYWDMIGREQGFANDNRPILPVLCQIELSATFRRSTRSLVS